MCTEDNKIAELLIKNCATLNPRDKDKRTPLHLAAEAGGLQNLNIIH